MALDRTPWINALHRIADDVQDLLKFEPSQDDNTFEERISRFELRLQYRLKYVLGIRVEKEDANTQ